MNNIRIVCARRSIFVFRVKLLRTIEEKAVGFLMFSYCPLPLSISSGLILLFLPSVLVLAGVFELLVIIGQYLTLLEMNVISCILPF